MPLHVGTDNISRHSQQRRCFLGLFQAGRACNCGNIEMYIWETDELVLLVSLWT